MYRNSKHILCSVTFFLFENRAVYEIMWEITVQPDRSQTTIWRMRVACCIPKATDTHSEFVIHIAFPRRKWSRERDSVLRYTRVFTLRIMSIFTKIRKAISALASSGLSVYPTVSTRSIDKKVNQSHYRPGVTQRVPEI